MFDLEPSHFGAGSLPGKSAEESPAPVIGLEHEFYLRRGDRRVDFREVIDHLEIPGRRIDPGDDRAYRLFSGHVITCDDEEAEYAVAPVPLRPGFTRAADQACRAVAGELRAALPSDISVEGASTHISVSCPDPLAPRVCSMIAQHFAPSLMLMADDGTSFGLLVRPRYGRVEFGLDYVSDRSLRATVAMAAGVVQACVAVLEHHLAQASLPPRLIVRTVPARRRYGLYVSRRAFPADLYYGGRITRLRLAEGGKITAGEHLELAWKCVRSSLEPLAEPGDLRDSDDMVAGMQPLPIETERSLEMLCSDREVATPFARLLAPVNRPGFLVSPVVLTWDLAVFVIAGRRRGYAVVPRDDLDSFARMLRSGELDEVIDAYLKTPDRGRAVPAYPGAVRQPRLFDRLESRSRLVTPERARNGVLELEDGTALTRPAPALPSAPGMWAAASAEPDPSETTLTASPQSTGHAAAASSTAVQRHGKSPPPPGSIAQDGFEEEPDEGSGLSPIGRLWAWLTQTSTTTRLVGIGLVVALVTALVLGGDGDPSTGTAPEDAVAQTAVEDEPGGAAVEDEPAAGVGDTQVTSEDVEATTGGETTIAPSADADAPSAELEAPDLAAAPFPAAWSYIATKTADLVPPPEFLTPSPIGTYYDGILVVNRVCEGDTCRYESTYDLERTFLDQAEAGERSAAVWERDGTVWSVEMEADVFQADYGSGIVCVIHTTEVWEVIVTDANLAEGEWVAGTFVGTLVKSDELDLASSTGGVDYCGDFWQVVEEWSVEGVAAG